MKIKVSEATNTQLNWLVAKCEGGWILSIESFAPHHSLGRMKFCTDWSQGGPIIEREDIDTYKFKPDISKYGAEYSVGTREGWHRQFGKTRLIAGLRCFVVSHLGDEVEVPDELL